VTYGDVHCFPLLFSFSFWRSFALERMYRVNVLFKTQYVVFRGGFFS